MSRRPRLIPATLKDDTAERVRQSHHTVIEDLARRVRELEGQARGGWSFVSETVIDTLGDTISIRGYDASFAGEWRLDLDVIFVTGTAKTVDLVPTGIATSDLDSIFNQGAAHTQVASAWRLASFTVQTRLWGRITLLPRPRTQGRTYDWKGGIGQAGTTPTVVDAFGTGHCNDNKTAITGLSITSSVANRIQVGSTVKLYQRFQ